MARYGLKDFVATSIQKDRGQGLFEEVYMQHGQ
jgi:hypothetical protein